MPAFLNSLQGGRYNSTCFYICNCITNELPLNGAKGVGTAFFFIAGENSSVFLFEQVGKYSRLFPVGKKIKWAVASLVRALSSL